MSLRPLGVALRSGEARMAEPSGVMAPPMADTKLTPPRPNPPSKLLFKVLNRLLKRAEEKNQPVEC